MTLSAGNTSENSNDATPAGGTAITATDDIRGIDPFIAATEAPGPRTRPWHSRLLDYSAHAAMIIGLLGFAWTVSEHVMPKETAAQIEAPSPKFADAKPVDPKTAALPAAPKPAAPVDEIGELRRANRQMAADIKALHASLDTVRGTIAKDHAPDQIHALTASLDEVKANLATTKTENHAALADLSTRVDALRQKAPVERVSRLEHPATDPAPTGSLPPEAKAIPTPPAKPATLASADESASGKTPILTGWVVRDVYDGVATIEGKRGSMEVIPGVSIPGAGVVKSIDRHGSGWTVTTSKGLLAYAAPPRDYRRVQSRDYYPAYRYDF